MTRLTQLIVVFSLSMFIFSAGCDDTLDPVDADLDGSDGGDSRDGGEQDSRLEGDTCVPDCTGRCCGSDGCDGECTDACGDSGSCDTETCECLDLSCGAAPPHPECDTLSPAPEEPVEIEAFVTKNAAPLKCIEGGEEKWNFARLESDMEDKSIFMFGEIHGSKELGPLSANIFEHLVRQGLINTLALEFVMDATESMNTYIQTGEGKLVSRYHFNLFSPNDFMRILLERARALNEEGFEITAFAVDTPWDLRLMNEQIESLAAGLSEDQSNLVLETMPLAPPGLAPSVDANFVQDAEDYHQHLIDNEAMICQDLSEADCEHLQMLARALWTGAFAASPLMYSAPDSEFMVFLRVREELVYYNYRLHITSENERVYAHMGRAHTAKGESAYGFSTAAGRLDNDYSLTQGRVYTTRSDNGPGSSTAYGGSVESSFPDYDFLADALADELFDTYALSTYMPDDDCVANPLAELAVHDSPLVYGDAYDTIIFVHLLTPDNGS